MHSQVCLAHEEILPCSPIMLLFICITVFHRMKLTPQCVQMLVFGATVLASVFLMLVQQPSRESVTWLLYLAAVWALLLPVTSFVQVPPSAPDAAMQA